MIIMNGCSYLAPDIIDDKYDRIDYKNVSARPSDKNICRNCKWYCSNNECLVWTGCWLDIYDMVK